MPDPAIADRILMGFKKETTFGDTPTAGNFQLFRLIDESLRQDVTYVDSREIRSDRQTLTTKRTNLMAAGGFNTELSAGQYDDFLEASLFADATWSAEITDVVADAAISADSAKQAYIGIAAEFTSYSKDEWVFVSGFVDAANNGWKKIVVIQDGALPSDDEMVVKSALALITVAASPAITITQLGSITNGTTATSFSIERQYTDLVSPDVFAIFKGLIPSQMSIAVVADQIITGAFEFLGKSVASATASVGVANDAAPSDEVMSAVEDVHAIMEGAGGVTGNPTDYSTTDFAFTLINNLRARAEVGQLGPPSIGAGTIGVTGTIRALFRDIVVIDKFLNDTLSELALIVQDSAGKGYAIDFPNVRYTSGQRVAGGQNTDIIADMAFTATMHSAGSTPENKTMRIARKTS